MAESDYNDLGHNSRDRPFLDGRYLVGLNCDAVPVNAMTEVVDLPSEELALFHLGAQVVLFEHSQHGAYVLSMFFLRFGALLNRFENKMKDAETCKVTRNNLPCLYISCLCRSITMSSR